MKFVIETFFDLFLEIFSFISLLLVIIFKVILNLALSKIAIFYFNFQGTVFLAAAFSAAIFELFPNWNGANLWQNIKIFYRNSKNNKDRVTLQFNPFLFLLGIIFLLVSVIINTLS
jgi:hypothetical protein